MRVVLVHGFTQTARSWDPVVRQLPTDGESLAVDVPVGLDFVATAAALGQAGGRAAYVGYSMGGRLCLQLALDRPDLVERLILISSSAGLDDPDARVARRDTDEQLAQEIERDGVDVFLLRWLAQPLFASLTVEDADLEDRGRHTAADLATTLRTLGAGVQEPLWDRLAKLAMPVWIVAGDRDPKFMELGRRMYDLIPGAELAVVSGAGHAAHLEHPDAIASVIAEVVHGSMTS
jgi:2-succinyl-6-hydroxy-2,4-cyclohexadiene-1-carboxylate synthase